MFPAAATAAGVADTRRDSSHHEQQNIDDERDPSSEVRAEELLDELWIGPIGHQSGLHSTTQESAHRFAAVVSIIERSLIDVHPHEPIGLGAIEASSIPLSIIECFFAMLEGIGDAPSKNL